jgi:hypothetical protein
MTACGRIETEDESLRKALKENRTMVASYQVGSQTAYLRARTGDPTGRHLHLDCALASYFPEGRVPKAPDEKDDVLALVAQFTGAEALVGVIGVFDLPIEELPEPGLIRSLSAEARSGDISVRLTGGKFTFKGAPIENIRWDISSDPERVRVVVSAEKRDKVDDRYLTRVLDWVGSQFRLFVEGQSADGGS